MPTQFYVYLAIFAGVVGLFVTGAAILMVYAFMAARKQRAADAADGESGAIQHEAWSWFMRWTAADYAVLLLFGFGFVFLLTDLVGVARDRDQFPMYHYAYLLCGVIFSSLGMLFSFLRLAIVLRLARRSTARDHTGKPDKAEQAE